MSSIIKVNEVCLQANSKESLWISLIEKRKVYFKVFPHKIIP